MAFTTMTNRAAGYIVAESDWDAITNNFDALNAGFHVPLFPHSSGAVPLSGLQGAAYSTVQSSDGGTIKPQWPVLQFDKDTDEGRIWNGTIPRLYASTMTVVGQYYMPTVTSGTIVLNAQIAAWSNADATVSAKAFDTVNALSADTVPGTALTIRTFSITMTNADSSAAIDSFCLALFRDVSEDTAAEDMYMKRLDLFFNIS